jgi:hypothetical protein
MNEKKGWTYHDGAKCTAPSWWFALPDGRVVYKVRELSDGSWTYNGSDTYVSAEAAMEAADKEV